jgi:hypothetical protein
MLGTAVATMPGAHAASDFAKGQPAPIIQMPDRAIGCQARLNLGKATKNALRTKGALQGFDMADAVQHRQDGGARINGRADGLNCLSQIIGLAGQQQYIPAGLQRIRRDGRDRCPIIPKAT